MTTLIPERIADLVKYIHTNVRAAQLCSQDSDVATLYIKELLQIADALSTPPPASGVTDTMEAALKKIISIKDDTLGSRDGAENEKTRDFDRGTRMAFYRCAIIAGEALEAALASKPIAGVDSLDTALEKWRKRDDEDDPAWPMDRDLEEVWQQGVSWALLRVGKYLGIRNWDADGASESIEGDVDHEIGSIFATAKLYDPEDGSWATLARPTPIAAPDDAKSVFDNRTDWELLKEHIAEDHGSDHHSDDCDICGAIRRLDSMFSESRPTSTERGAVIPDIVAHTDGEEGETIGWHVAWSDKDYVYCGEISDALWGTFSEEQRDNVGGINCCWMLEIKDEDGHRLIGRAAGPDEAFEIIKAFRDSRTQSPPPRMVEDAEMTKLLGPCKYEYRDGRGALWTLDQILAFGRALQERGK